MKKGGYQILELNCESDVNVIDDYKNVNSSSFTKIIKGDNGDNIEDFIFNIYTPKKTCLLKNLLVNGNYLTLFSSLLCSIDNVIFYVVDSSKQTGYTTLQTSDDNVIFKLNDDYILITNLDGKGYIIKLYKGAITQ